MTAGLFALTLAAAAPPAGLQTGDEFTFAGSVVEEVHRPAEQFRREHALELRVLVLDGRENWSDAAVLTRLKRTGDAVAGAVPGVTGGTVQDSPAAVRFDLVRVHADGTVHLLVPDGPPPLKLAADTPVRALPAVPLDTFAPFEFGVFPPQPPRNNAGEPWTVAAGTRPPETWQATKTDTVNAERCRVFVMNQAHPNWVKPVGGQTAWHRADAVWVSTLDGTARKVHRVIRHRDGKDEQPAAWVEVKYELKNQTRLGGRGLERARRDAELAYAALADAAQSVPDAAKLGPKAFELRLAKLEAQIAETDEASPYREAMLAARRSFEAARRGEVVPAQFLPAAPAVAAPARPAWPEVGQLAPDFKAGTFRLAEHRGKPVVLVFFRPGGETADLSLAVAAALEKRYGPRAMVVPLAVFGDVAAGVKDRDRLKLTIPIRDGSAAVALYGIETAPRFALIDAAGKVRWSFTGVGAETGFLLKEQADGLVTPASPNGAAGTTAPSGLQLPPIVPRP